MAKKNAENLKNVEYVWEDRVRHLGMPLSFTRFRLSEDRIFLEKGLFNLQADEILLYRVRDLHLSISLGQRLCGVGTVTILSSDKSLPTLELKNIKHPRQVKETLHQYVEAAKEKRRMRPTEVFGDEQSGQYGDMHDDEDEDFD